MQKKYLRMLAGLSRGGPLEWSVYILCCGDGSLYTGIAKNVERRVQCHQRGRGAAYTRTHLPVRLIYQEPAMTRSQALIREAAIKRLPRAKKERLLISATPDHRSGQKGAKAPAARFCGRLPRAASQRNFGRLKGTKIKGDFHDPSPRQPHPRR